MKKIGLFCAVILACGSLAACGNQSASNSKKNSSISSLKAENSSLKAKKSSNRNHRHHQLKRYGQSDNNVSSSSTSKIAGNSKRVTNSNSSQSTSQKNVAQTSNTVNNNSTNQTTNSHTGDWHNDSELWNAANNADYSGTIFENATPQERYDYLWGQADHNQPQN